MARPSKRPELIEGKLGKENLKNRIEKMKELQGGVDRVEPYSLVTDRAIEYFYDIAFDLLELDMLGNSDRYTIESIADLMDKKDELNEQWRTETDSKEKRALLKDIDGLTKTISKLFNDLGLNAGAKSALAKKLAEAEEEKNDVGAKAINDLRSEDNGENFAEEIAKLL